MRKKISVILSRIEVRNVTGERYRVEQVTESTEPTVDSVLTKTEVDKYCASPRYKVTIKRAKGD